MSRTRSYHEGCPISHSLDLVGERWSLLVVRELMLGPKRFTDLEAGLLTVSPNVLSQRLRELEEIGVVRRRRLGPPTGSWVYELTDWGRRLERVLVELADWAHDSPLHDVRLPMSVDSLLIAMRSRHVAATEQPIAGTCALRVGDDCFSVRYEHDRMDVVRGDPVSADATVETDLATLQRLMVGDESMTEAADAGRLKAVGDIDLVRRLMTPLRPRVA
jgi:DNA-binding HxlR family transcriptional regulator